MKKPALVLLLGILTVMLIACAPVITSIAPTLTPMLSPTPTITYTLVATSTVTLTPIPSPLPSSTASFGFKRVSVKEFIPNLSLDVPISFEVPKDFVPCSDYFDTYFWSSQKCEGPFRPQNTSYFQAKLAPNVTYDSQIDKFIHTPNDFNDSDMMFLLESTGAKLTRIERKNIGEFPVLILELKLPYAEEPGETRMQMVNRAYIATLIDTNVLWIDYYFYTDFENESLIWKHFESSFEKNP